MRSACLRQQLVVHAVFERSIEAVTRIYVYTRHSDIRLDDRRAIRDAIWPLRMKNWNTGSSRHKMSGQQQAHGTSGRKPANPLEIVASLEWGLHDLVEMFKHLLELLHLLLRCHKAGILHDVQH